MDAQEFKQRFMPYHRLLYRVAYHTMGNQQDAEDLLQDTYLKLWTKRDDLPPEAQSEAYLITLMRNLYRDQRRLKHIETVPLEIDEANQPDEARLSYETHDEVEQMRGLIEHLPDKQRQVMQMHVEEDRNYQEIQQATGLSPGNIRVIISRTKKLLQEQFNQLTKSWTN